jgi:hypothetical protein
MGRTATSKNRQQITEGELRRFRAFVRLTAPEPGVLRLIGEESRRNGTEKLTSRQINRIICETRARMKATAKHGLSAK